MSNSILTSTKKILGIAEDYTDFDVDVMMYINSVFATLDQLGIGPEGGFMIENSAPTWSQYLVNDMRLNSVKTYVYLRVRLLFDPPATSYHITAIEEQILAHEWRLSAYRESYAWTSPVPTPVVVPEDPYDPYEPNWADGPVLDGGVA